MRATHHRLCVHRQLGPLGLEADLSFSAAWTLIFGPSGSGKSSLLRAACGLLGRTGVEFTRQDARGGWTVLTGLTPHLRALSYAPQSPTLFPHLSVRENVAFASQSTAKHRDKTMLVEQALELFEVSAHADRLPRELSGGERRRVNLARAFAVPDARLMLLDEPFSGVDRAMRDALLPRMQEWLRQREVPVVSVSHDVDEALMLGAEVVVLEQGSVVGRGPAAEVLHQERTRMLEILRRHRE